MKSKDQILLEQAYLKILKNSNILNEGDIDIDFYRRKEDERREEAKRIRKSHELHGAFDRDGNPRHFGADPWEGYSDQLKSALIDLYYPGQKFEVKLLHDNMDGTFEGNKCLDEISKELRTVDGITLEPGKMYRFDPDEGSLKPL
jgi:hypothetical protein